MNRKNIKVSEIVHDKMSLLKRPNETFDDVLKRELDILPSDINELTAFYPDRMQMGVREIVSIIESAADFERTIVEYGEYHALEFTHPQSGFTIVQVQFHEDTVTGMKAVYRDHHGEMAELVDIGMQDDYSPDDKLDDMENPLVYVGPIPPDGTYEDVEEAIELDRFKQSLERKLSGSYERWGE